MKGFVVASLLSMSPAIAQAAPVESFVEAPGPQGPLKGTMLAPEAKAAPVVLILPGSGPTDRDGNSGLGIRASTYRLLAEGLAARGIASVSDRQARPWRQRGRRGGRQCRHDGGLRHRCEGVGPDDPSQDGRSLRLAAGA